jgi:hypothetical protein
MLLTSLPRFTLMLYEPGSASDGHAAQENSEKLRRTSTRILQAAYEGLQEPDLATLVIGLRTADYGERLTDMLNVLDMTNHLNPHYGGWARHSYNDTLATHSERGQVTARPPSNPQAGPG